MEDDCPLHTPSPTLFIAGLLAPGPGWTSVGVFPPPASQHAAAPKMHIHRCVTTTKRRYRSGDFLRYLDLPALHELFLWCPLHGDLALPFLHCTTALRKFTYGISYPPANVRAFFLVLDRGNNADFLPQLDSLEMCLLTHTVDGPVVTALRSRSPGFTSNLVTTPLRLLRLLGDSKYGENAPLWDEMSPIDWDALRCGTMARMSMSAGKWTIIFGLV
ncbi:hypothetical protein C8R47DRAFT_1295319 [Mycena vitilis]|nr:hypothetical protein C8R47DRAFT_1295319 [Mycena vitilis]